jgi:hypothetical protein
VRLALVGIALVLTFAVAHFVLAFLHFVAQAN